MKTLVSAFAILAFLAANSLSWHAYAQAPAGAAAPATNVGPEPSAPASTKHATHKTTKHTAKKKSKGKPVKSSTVSKKSTQSSLLGLASRLTG